MIAKIRTKPFIIFLTAIQSLGLGSLATAGLADTALHAVRDSDDFYELFYRLEAGLFDGSPDHHALSSFKTLLAKHGLSLSDQFDGNEYSQVRHLRTVKQMFEVRTKQYYSYIGATPQALAALDDKERIIEYSTRVERALYTRRSDVSSLRMLKTLFEKYKIADIPDNLNWESYSELRHVNSAKDKFSQQLSSMLDIGVKGGMKTASTAIGSGIAAADTSRRAFGFGNFLL